MHTSYPAAMHLDKLCSIELRYLDAHFPKPYGDESGPGWGIGEGTVSGERLSGTLKWSNHPSLRSDGVALPDFRGVISTADGAKVLVSFTGRTVNDKTESDTRAHTPVHTPL